MTQESTITIPHFNLKDEMENTDLRYMKRDMQNYLSRKDDWFVENALKDKFHLNYKGLSINAIISHLELNHNQSEDASVVLEREISDKEAPIIEARAIEAVVSNIEFENGKAIGYWLNGKLCL